jgi:hypothetical protein
VGEFDDDGFKVVSVSFKDAARAARKAFAVGNLCGVLGGASLHVASTMHQNQTIILADSVYTCPNLLE